MIEECKDILECENRLSPVIPQINLLGEIPLSTEEIDKLGAFIKKPISENIQKGTEFLKTKTPTCLACFLVWKGILSYRDGDYWSGVQESTGLSDPNWQAKWGEIFINFLKGNGLAFCDIQDAYRYVTPILIHGMIPNSCLDEYFEKILFPIVKHELADSTDHNGIKFLLQVRREDDNKRYVIEKEIRELRTKKDPISSKLKRVRSLIKIWDDLDKIKALEEKAGSRDVLAFLPEDPLEYKSKKNSAIQKLQKEIGKLESEKKQCEQQRKIFSEVDKEALAHSYAINQYINILPGLEQELRQVTELKAQENLLKERIEKDAQSIFPERWDERYALLILDLPFDKLKDKIEAFNSRRISESSVRQGYFDSILRVIKGWTNYFFSSFIKREKTAQEIQVEISEILKDLPIDKRVIKCPQPELVHNLKQLCDDRETICRLREIRNSVEIKTSEQIRRIQSVAEAVDVDITDNIRSIVTSLQNKLADAHENEQSADQAERQIEEIEYNIKELMAKEDFLVEELQKIDNCLAKLGNDDIQSGIEQLKRRRDAQRKAESLRNNLMSRYPDLDSLEREKDEAKRNGKDKRYYNSKIGGLVEEIEQIKQWMTEFKERVKQIPKPFPHVDEPIRRFLLYGGDRATDFLIQSVQMVNQTTEKQKVSSADESGLPERVVTKFGEWWGRRDITDGEELEDKIIGLKRFRSPVIYLDTAIAEIRVHFPSQRFSMLEKSTGLCLIINEDKPDSHEKQLRVFRFEKDLLETEELDFPLPFPSANYEFTLKSDSQIIRCWNMQGISATDHPFMAFNYISKKLIKETELPKEKILILLHNRFDLEPSQIIIEEASLYGKWKEYKYKILDLSAVKQLYLVNKQGEKTPIPISSEKIFEPTLYSGQILKGCCSEEVNIYVGEPPSIHIPIESDAETRRWIISILKDRDSTLTESKYYRLSELVEISNIAGNEGLLIIPLSNEKCIGKSPVGRFTVRLRNDVRYIGKRLSFYVVPYLKLGFDKDIYLPCEEDISQVCLTIDGSKKMEFEPQGPAKIIDRKDNSYRLETTSSEHSIHGILRYACLKGDLIPISITIEIPRLTWRLDGMPNNEYSSESNRIEEIWFGDLENAEETLSLIVSMPSFINGQGQLSLSDIDQVSEKKIREGKIRFDLLDFSDTLRAGDEPLHTFELTVPDSELSIDNVELFTVRTRWEVEGIECVQKFYNGMLILKISWKEEKGKSECQRVIRLWDIESPDSDPDTWEVPEDSYGMEIKKEKDKIPPGIYRVHIDVKDEDSWSSTRPTMPPDDSLNTLDIQIQEEILQGQINITSVIDRDDRVYGIDGRYSIHIEGKIIGGKLPNTVHDNNDILIKEVTNEGWYMGNISVGGKSPFETEINAVNPVKFEYISTKHFIEAIEDKDGDGVYFCTLCKELFWSHERYKQEKRNGHEKKILSPDEKHPEFKIKFRL